MVPHEYALERAGPRAGRAGLRSRVKFSAENAGGAAKERGTARGSSIPRDRQPGSAWRESPLSSARSSVILFFFFCFKQRPETLSAFQKEKGMAELLSTDGAGH